MKNKILQVLMITTVILATKNINAQQGFHIGAQFTPHMSWLMNQDDVDSPSFDYIETIRGSMGLNTKYAFSNNLGIGVDALYSFQGQRYKLGGLELFKKVEYVKIPAIAIYEHTLVPSVKMIYKLGPQVGVLTFAQLADKNGNAIIKNQKAAYMDLDLSAVTSVGIGFHLANNVFLDLAIRVDYGFINAEDADYKMNVNEPVVMNGNGNTNATGGTYSAERTVTNTMTAGITIGLRYLFGSKSDTRVTDH